MQYTRIPVHDAGGMSIHLPVVDIGPSPARLAIVAGIRIVAAANPPALLQRARWSNWDDDDMNRVGDGGGEPSLTRRLAEAVCKAVDGCELCVNLHNFVMRTPLLAIWPPGLSGERAARHRARIEALDPHVVWVFGDTIVDQNMFSTSLDAALERRGVEVLAVEMADLPELDEPLLARGVAGLFRLAGLCGCLEARERPLRKTTVFVKRQLLRAPGAGIFEPVAPLAGMVQEKDVVGELIPMERPGDRVAVSSPAAGYLVQRLSRRFVRPGDMIATVGIPVPHPE